MGLNEDLAADVLAEAVPGRAIRSYPALLSTEADALSWARSGAPDGAVVVAGYQASPRGRAGIPWSPAPGASLAFSLVLYPDLPAEREGWLYTVAACGLADVLGPEAAIGWPDEVWVGERQAGAVGVNAELGPDGVRWAVLNLLIADAVPPRAPLLARVVEAVEARQASAEARVCRDYVDRCRTLGSRVRARMIPVGPAGPQVEGRAVNATGDGALVVETDGGRRVAVRPQHLGLLDIV